MEFSWPVRVYIEDTDAGGIVYYVNYLKFVERARTEFLRHLKFDHADMIKQGSMFVVNSAQIDYRAPARLDDPLVVKVAIAARRRTHVTFKQKILHEETGVLMAEARVGVACVSTGSMKPTAVPEAMTAMFDKYLDIADGG